MAATSSISCSRPRLEASTHGLAFSSAGVPRAITWPQWMTEISSASENRNSMSCSMMTMVRCPSACAPDSASRARPSLPRPAVGSSRNSSFGLAGERHGDLQRAARAVGQRLGQRRRHGRRGRPCRGSSCASSDRTRDRHRPAPSGLRAAVTRRRQRDGDVLEHRELVEQGHESGTSGRRPGGRSSCGERPVMSRPSSSTRPRSGL